MPIESAMGGALGSMVPARHANRAARTVRMGPGDRGACPPPRARPFCYHDRRMPSPPAPVFGELEWSIDPDPAAGAPVSSSQPTGAEPPPPPSDGETRAARVDSALLAVARGGGSLPTPTPRRRSSIPSTSGIEGGRDAIAELRELYARGDAAAALELAAELGSRVVPRTAAPPAWSAEDGTAVAVAGHRASILPAMISRAGVPRVVLPAAEIAKLAIDHKAGFLLAHVDGMHTMEEVLDVCAMPEAEALAILERLCALGVIELA